MPKNKMNKNNLKAGITKEKVIFLLGCICLVSIIIVEIVTDILNPNIHILNDEWPKLSAPYIFRSIIIFISILVLLFGLIGHRKPKLVLSEGNRLSFERVSISIVLLISIITLFLFIFRSSLFNALSKEDNLIEWGSALFLFGSSFVIAFSFLRNYYVLKNSNLIRLTLGFASIAFFILAMEEVSWFQRELQIETPKLFDNNEQQEMNLHNFHTDRLELIFYFGMFVFLVVVPFIRLLFPSILDIKYLKTFMARPFIGVLGSVACAYNFDMWNVIFIQITFFSSVLILCVFAIFSSLRNERYIILTTILLLITSQILFLMNGANFDRLWEITEYKEFFISLALLIYSCDVFIHSKENFGY